MEAVRATAQKLKLPLAEAMDDATKIFVHHKYPLVLLDEPKYFREISFRLANSKYVVELLSWVDNRMFQKEQEVILSSLDDVAKVINLWLLEKQTIKEIQDVYPVDYTD
jgi:hypothetical protein